MRAIPIVPTLLLALALVPPAAAQDARLAFEIPPADSALVPALTAYAAGGAERVETLFGAPFPRTVTVRVFPDRQAFDAHLREAWGIESACWMVGGAEEEALVLLSPRVWSEEACDHDPSNAAEIEDLVAHELVHVYHMQVHPSVEFEGVEGLDWFVEGVATWASGQLQRSQARRAAEAVETGAAPTSLDEAWTGPYRYGVAGSMAAFVADRVGPEAMARLLTASSRAEVLDAVGLDEPAFLEAWARWVVGGASSGPPPGGVSGPGAASDPAGL